MSEPFWSSAKIRALSSQTSLQSYDLSFLSDPSFGKWRLAEDTCRFIGRVCEEVKPRTVVEFGTGLSTLVLSKEVQRGNVGEVVSVDHLEVFPGHPREEINRQQHASSIRFVHRPIGPRWLAGRLFQFYKRPECEPFDEDRIDMVLIDGPPYFFDSREAVMYEVFNRLSDHAIVLLDDAAREKYEQKYLANWRRFFGDAIECEIMIDEFEKGLACLWKTGKDTSVQPFPFFERATATLNAVYRGGLGVRQTVRKLFESLEL